MKPDDTLREIPNSGSHNCFACSPANRYGLRMQLFAAEKSVHSWLAVPDHMGGWNRVVHGGIVSTILDEIMGWAGLYFLKQVTMTHALRVEFLAALYVGRRLHAEARLVEFDGKRRAVLKARLFDEGDKLCARATGEFKVMSPKVARRLGVMSDEDMKTFFEPLLRM